MGASCTDIREFPNPEKESVLEKTISMTNSRRQAPVTDPLDEDMADGDPVYWELEDSENSVEQALDCTKVEGKTSVPKAPEREEKHILNIIFKQPQLGIVVNSGIDGYCAYVTAFDKEKNPMLKEVDLPKFSKVLLVNGVDVEMWPLQKMVDSIIKFKENPPLTITFCHPHGLGENEVPDLNPLTIKRNSSNFDLK